MNDIWKVSVTINIAQEGGHQSLIQEDQHLPREPKINNSWPYSSICLVILRKQCMMAKNVVSKTATNIYNRSQA